MKIQNGLTRLLKGCQNLNEEERKIIDYILTTFENNKK